MFRAMRLSIAWVIPSTWIVMRIGKRMPEPLCDARFEALRDSVLQHFGLRVNLIPGVGKRFDQKELEQAVMAKDFERRALAEISKHHAAVGLVGDQIQLGQPLQHARDRGRCEAKMLGQQRGRNLLVLLLKLVDRFNVILDRWRQLCFSNLLSWIHSIPLARAEAVKMRLT